jgi:hypothetical protein
MRDQSIQLENHKKITVRQGNLCETEDEFDLLICSAFKGDYLPIEGTLIGSLEQSRGISVGKLAEHPFLDYREENGCWASEAIEGSIHRIGCIELLEYCQLGDPAFAQATILKEMFASVGFLLKQIDREKAGLHRVAMPVLGSGNQGLERCYIIPPLISQCKAALESIPQLSEIVFYELHEENAKNLYEELQKTVGQTKTAADVFISYSSAQRDLADTMKNFLEEHGISCWMAPYSIPSGSSYQAEIPAALNNTSAVVLLLSEDSEKSRWVQKEVGSTIGARHCLIPYMDHEYEHSQQFNFLLDGEQIFEAWTIEDEGLRYQTLLEEICRKLNRSAPEKREQGSKTTNPTEPATNPVVQELKQLNRILQVGFAGIFLLKLLELLVKLVLHKKSEEK